MIWFAPKSKDYNAVNVAALQLWHSYQHTASTGPISNVWNGSVPPKLSASILFV